MNNEGEEVGNESQGNSKRDSQIIWGFIGLVLLIFVFKPWTLFKSSPSSINELPRIEISGQAANTVVFSDWESKDLGLSGRMKWIGPLAPVRIRFLAYAANGDLLSEGPVDYPGSLTLGETGRVEVFVGTYWKEVKRVVIIASYR